jgi:chemotaxis protein methyltransferase CheR
MPLAERDLAYVRDLVYGSCAIVIEASKDYLVEARLTPVAREGGFADLSAMVSHLRSSATNGMHAKVVEAMTTNETTFFRDVNPFEMLREEVLPRLIQARAATRALTIWCAACSTGQEPYSIAMLLREHFPQLDPWRVRIVATDVSLAALERAKEGRYRQLEVNRGLPAKMLVKYFDRVGAEFFIKPQIRQSVEYLPANLIKAWPAMGVVDVVFMRNVLIYFDVETKKRLLGRVHDLLSPDGVLFLGGAETTLNLESRFQRVASKGAVAYGRAP